MDRKWRPRLCHVADIMRRTRAKYHYSLRYTKRCENDRRKRKMAESVSTNNQHDLWLETRPGVNPPSTIPNPIPVDFLIPNPNTIPVNLAMIPNPFPIPVIFPSAIPTPNPISITISNY